MPESTPDTRPIGEILTQRQRMLVLIALVMSMFVSSLDASILATATPRIVGDLGGFSLLSWVFTIYLLCSTVTIPIVGKLSDQFGRKVFLIGGIVIFVVGSVACGVTPSMVGLIVARGVQGVGGGIIMATVFATLGDLFSPMERAKYFSFFVGAGTVASLSGPALGGLLSDGPGWRWCFYINVPVGAVAIGFISRHLPQQRKGGKLSRIDFPGAALLSGATVSLLLALAWAQKEFGWGSPETVGLLVGSVALTGGFIVQERRHPEPIIQLRLFRNSVFTQANLLSLLLTGSMFGAIQYLPTFIQTALGASATASGLVSTPQSLGVFASSLLGGQLIGRTGRYKYQVIAGALLIFTATLLLQTLDVGMTKWHISAFIVLYGLGSGMIMPAMSVVIQSSVSQEYTGVATSVRTFFMQIGQVLGAAVLGVVLASSYSSSLSSDIKGDPGISAETYKKLEDPTLVLNKREFAQLQTELRSQPNGEAVLDRALTAQKESVATAIRHVFLASSIGALLVVIIAITMREIPLRRTLSTPPPEEQATAGAAPPPPGRAMPVLDDA